MMTKRLFLGLVMGITLMAIQLSAAEGPWLTDYDKALAQAKKDNKLMLMNFTGSDWCPPCKALKRNVFTKKAFQEYAAKNLVLVEVDFPRRKQQSAELRKANRALAKKFKIEGYPTVLIQNPTGKILLKEVGFQGDTADTYVKKVKNLDSKK